MLNNPHHPTLKTLRKPVPCCHLMMPASAIFMPCIFQTKATIRLKTPGTGIDRAPLTGMLSGVPPDSGFGVEGNSAPPSREQQSKQSNLWRREMSKTSTYQ